MRTFRSLSLASMLLLAPALPLVHAQSGHTNAVANAQTDVVTASTDKQGKALPSPRHQLDFTHDHNGAKTHIVITYGAPSLRGRSLDQVVPSGHWWRAGANEATSFTTDHDVRLGSLSVPAGSYTLFVQPDASGWQLIVNKQTGQWGTKYDQAQDFGRVPMTSSPSASPQETLKYYFDHVTAHSATLHLAWGDKDESVVVTFPGS